MPFPNTNKIRKADEVVGENLKLLEEHLANVNYKVILTSWFSFLGVFLLSVFLTIVVIRLALHIF